MGLFSRKPKRPAYISEPYLRGLRDFGEHLVGQRAGYNTDLLADLDMMDFAQEDPSGYVEMLAAGIFRGPSHISGYVGPSCLGAAEAVVNVHGIDVSSPAWDQIVDAAITYLRSCGIPYTRIKPYLRARWEQAHSPAEW